MLRDYGSELFELIDAPYSAATKLAIIAATAEALMIWEPRIDLDEVAVTSFTPGKVILEISGRYLPNGREVTLDGIVVT